MVLDHNTGGGGLLSMTTVSAISLWSPQQIKHGGRDLHFTGESTVLKMDPCLNEQRGFLSSLTAAIVSVFIYWILGI